MEFVKQYFPTMPYTDLLCFNFCIRWNCGHNLLNINSSIPCISVFSASAIRIKKTNELILDLSKGRRSMTCCDLMVEFIFETEKDIVFCFIHLFLSEGVKYMPDYREFEWFSMYLWHCLLCFMWPLIVCELTVSSSTWLCMPIHSWQVKTWYE